MNTLKITLLTCELIKTPLAPMTVISADGKAIAGLLFAHDDRRLTSEMTLLMERLSCHNLVQGNDEVIADTKEQLSEYLSGHRREFDIPILISGTDFQRIVLQRLLEIPFGETKTYHEIAAEAGRPAASRAVGNACGSNPLAIVIPCHRVVGASGSLGGYSGGLDLKKKLLELEAAGR